MKNQNCKCGCKVEPHKTICKHCQPSNSPQQVHDWEKKFSKYYRTVFDCGVWEALMDDISALLQQQKEELKRRVSDLMEYYGHGTEGYDALKRLIDKL